MILFSPQKSLLCLPPTLFHSKTYELHGSSHVGLYVARSFFNQYYSIPFPQKKLSFFGHNWIDSQLHNYKNMKQNKIATLQFSKV